MQNPEYTQSFLPQLTPTTKYQKPLVQPTLPANWQRQLQGLTDVKSKNCPPNMALRKQDFLNYRQPRPAQSQRFRNGYSNNQDPSNDSALDDYLLSQTRSQTGIFPLSQEQYNMLLKEEAHQQQKSQRINQQIQNYVNQENSMNSLPYIVYSQTDAQPVLQSSTLYYHSGCSTQSHTKSNFGTDNSSSLAQTDLNMTLDMSYQYYDDEDDDSNIEGPNNSINYLNYTKHRNDYQSEQLRPSSNQLIDQQFQEMLIMEINQFCKSKAQTLREAIIIYKSYIVKHKKRTTLNFKKIAAKLGWEQKLCYQKYEGLQQKVLDKYSQAEIKQIKQDVIAYYQQNKEQVNYDKKKLNENVKKFIYDKYKINLQFNKNQRQIHNLIIYQINSMLRADQKI